MNKDRIERLLKDSETLNQRTRSSIIYIVNEYEKVNKRLKTERRNLKTLMEKSKDERIKEAEAQLEKLTKKIRAMKAQELDLENRNYSVNRREHELNLYERELDERVAKIKQKMAGMEMLEAMLLDKANNMPATRLEVVEMMPCKEDSEALKKAWFYLFNALRANGGAMEPWAPTTGRGQ